MLGAVDSRHALLCYAALAFTAEREWDFKRAVENVTGHFLGELLVVDVGVTMLDKFLQKQVGLCHHATSMTSALDSTRVAGLHFMAMAGVTSLRNMCG
jgi:hypothetical protein